MDTIFAQASGVGRAGVVVIRISGVRAGDALCALNDGALPAPRHASLCTLRNPSTGETIDRALVLWFPAPHSFTGENVAELHLHGSTAVVQEMTRILSGMAGVRLAEPGEFSRRAFENGKMDLAQAEGLADLIEATTSAQRKQALRQMDGELTRLYESWRAALVKTLAYLEAYVDFPDEDLPPELEQQIQHNAGELRDAIAAHLADTRGRRIREGVYVAIVGAPNVGKSSLINALARREVAIVSPEAGTTRDALEAHLDIGGVPVTLCDTAGLREAGGTIEAEGIRRTRARAEMSDIKICMFEAGREADPETLALVDGASLVVVNKIDTYPALPTGGDVLLLSITTGQGVDALIDALAARVQSLAGLTEPPAFTRERHRAALSAGHAALEHFLAGGNAPDSIECRAEDLRAAAQSLGSIAGRIGVEELFDTIFSSFCIGK